MILNVATPLLLAVSAHDQYEYGRHETSCRLENPNMVLRMTSLQHPHISTRSDVVVAVRSV